MNKLKLMSKKRKRDLKRGMKN